MCDGCRTELQSAIDAQAKKIEELKTIMSELLPILRMSYYSFNSDVILGDPSCDCNYCSIYRKATDALKYPVGYNVGHFERKSV